MRSVRFWLASALAASLVLGSVAFGDSQDDKGGPTAGKKGGKGGGKKGGGKAGDNKGGPRGGFDGGPGGPGGLGGFASAERALDEMKLDDKKREKAETIVKAYGDNVRKLLDLARSDLLVKMKDVLSEQELKTFTTALERRPPGPGGPGGPRGPGRGGPGGRGGRGLTVDQIVERIMAFDKNKDGKITKDELPERMQDLIAKGDTNKDGALDKDEVKALAAKIEKEGFPGFDGRGGPGGRGGRGPGGPFGRGPGGPGGFASAERALDELKLADKTREKAEAVVKAYSENVRKLLDLARSDLLLKMKDVLSEQELKTFTTALERRPAGFGGFGGRGGRGGPDARGGPPPADNARSADLEKKLDQIQKQLEELRREIRR
jgi:hypothetical protein